MVAAFATLAQIGAAAGAVSETLDLVLDSLAAEPRDRAVWLRGLYHYELPSGPLPVSFEFRLLAPAAGEEAADPATPYGAEIEEPVKAMTLGIAP